MKLINKLAVLLVVQISYCQVDYKYKLQYEIMYDLNYQINKDDPNARKSEIMVLAIGHDYSQFFSDKKGAIESAIREAAKTGQLDSRNVPKTKFKYQIVKDKYKNQVLFFNSFGTTKLYYESPLREMTWKLENEERIILEYTCKKATTTFAGREYIAWYAPEIPIPDGPYKFGGLPGLILEIYDTQNHYHFLAIGMETVDKMVTNDFSAFLKVSALEYKEFEKKVRDKPSLLAQSDNLSFPKEMLDKIDANGKKKFAYENNPIELE